MRIIDGGFAEVSVKFLFFSLRPKHWIKNLFIFLPLIFGKKLFIFPANLRTTVAFFIFSMATGVVYLINDIMDLKNDKFHPIKRTRPIASGKVTIKQAWVTVYILGALSITLSFLLNTYFGWIVISLLLFNLIYTKFLKNVVIIDVFCISFFFFLRILAGSSTAGVSLSCWIIFMTVLLALFLGFNKRRQEIELLKTNAASYRSVLGKYTSYLIDRMIIAITASIMVVYIVYTLDTQTIHRAGSSHLIYTIPFVFYGIFRYLYLIHRRFQEGDPIRILLSDGKMQLNLISWLIVSMAVIYFGL